MAVARFILCIFFTFYFFWRSDHLSNPDDPLFIHATRGRKESCCFNCSTLTRLARSIGQPAPRRRRWRGWQRRRHDSMLAYLRWKKEAARRQFDNPRWPLLCHCLARSLACCARAWLSFGSRRHPTTLKCLGSYYDRRRKARYSIALADSSVECLKICGGMHGTVTLVSFFCIGKIGGRFWGTCH